MVKQGQPPPLSKTKDSAIERSMMFLKHWTSGQVIIGYTVIDGKNVALRLYHEVLGMKEWRYTIVTTWTVPSWDQVTAEYERLRALAVDFVLRDGEAPANSLEPITGEEAFRARQALTLRRLAPITSEEAYHARRARDLRGEPRAERHRLTSRDCVEWGSGHARYLDHFPCRSTHVFEYAKEPACGGNIGLFGTMRCGDLEDPATVPEAAYDLVLCFHVFNMLPGASPRVPAAALARLLRRGGSLLWAAPSAVPSFTALPDTLRFTLRGATALFADALCVVDAAPSSDAATTLAALAGFSAEDVPRRGPPDAGLSSMVYLWAVKPADPGFRGCDGYAAGDAAPPAPAGAPAPPVTASCADRPRALRALSSALGAGLDPDAAAAARRRLVDDRTCSNAAP